MGKELNGFLLSAILIVSLAAIVLTGMAVTQGFSLALRKTITTGDNVTVVASLEASNVSNRISAYPFIQSMSGCSNASDGTVLPTANYTVGEGDKTGGTIAVRSDWAGTALNCSSIVNLADTNAQASADKFTTGLAIFGTFSVILILAIVGKAIIGLFRKKD